MNEVQDLKLCRYYVNKNALGNGIHEVHKDDCNLLPNQKTCIDLGIHMNYKSAIVKAMDYYQQTKCCLYCTGDCKPIN